MDQHLYIFLFWLTRLIMLPVNANYSWDFSLENHVSKQLSVAEEKSQKQQQYGMVQELLKESNHLREELHDLKCLRHIRAEERGRKHRELLRAQVHTRTETHLKKILMSSLLLLFIDSKCQMGHWYNIEKCAPAPTGEIWHFWEHREREEERKKWWFWSFTCLHLPTATEWAHPAGAQRKRPDHLGPQKAQHNSAAQVLLFVFMYLFSLFSTNVCHDKERCFRETMLY